MKTPAFWRKNGVTSTVLSPFSCLYRWAHASRIRGIEAKALPVPVLCVGNVTAGGAGKTPTVIALLEWLRKQGVQAQCISRGYGGALHGPVRVEEASHTAAQVGDEPLLIAQTAPCWVGKHRLSVATAAVLDGAPLIVMDDGLQNPSLKKDLNLLVIDGGYGIGNGRVLPAGPLRESLAQAVAKTQAVILIGTDKTGILPKLPAGLPILHATLVAEDNARFTGKKYLAFAGIGRPEKFFDSLRETGAEILQTVAYADHHPYTERELAELHKTAARLGARLVTTQKDMMRIPLRMQPGIDVLRIRLEFSDKTALAALCAPLLARVGVNR